LAAEDVEIETKAKRKKKKNKELVRDTSAREVLLTVSARGFEQTTERLIALRRR
jgi:predicted MarR family transcription regulator